MVMLLSPVKQVKQMPTTRTKQVIVGEHGRLGGLFNDAKVWLQLGNDFVFVNLFLVFQRRL